MQDKMGGMQSNFVFVSLVPLFFLWENFYTLHFFEFCKILIRNQ